MAWVSQRRLSSSLVSAVNLLGNLPYLLLTVTILDAGRNALSFFLLLVVSLGLSVVRESLGPVLKRCTILAGLHFVFGGEDPHTVTVPS
jgi:hypothetical protein